MLLLLSSILLAQSAISQASSRTVTGLLTSAEDGAPLEGVRIVAKGSGAITGTLLDGVFYLPITDEDSILLLTRDDLIPKVIRLTTETDYSTQLQIRHAADHTFSPDGVWRAAFKLSSGVEVPVVFDIHTDKDGGRKAFFHNGEERFEGGRVAQTGDSLFVYLDQFDNELAFHITDSALTGVLRRQDRTGVPLPVKAVRGDTVRFKGSRQPPAGDLTGTYAISFTGGNGKEEKAVGVLRQDGNRLHGTFLRITGDARYLEGLVEDDHFFLSSFIGSTPVYYRGDFTSTGRLTGESVGVRGNLHFTGVRDETAALPDAYGLTGLKNGYTSFDFSFPDLNGRPLTLHDAKFKDKVVIVTIGGTWCPNCIDEATFLAPWYIANRSRGIEVVSIFYERQLDTAYVKKALTRFRERFNIQFDQVFGGLADKQVVAASLPELNTFLAFPTTIIIDKKGRVARIHTGYSGPATGKYYQQFIKEFDEEINALL